MGGTGKKICLILRKLMIPYFLIYHKTNKINDPDDSIILKSGEWIICFEKKKKFEIVENENGKFYLLGDLINKERLNVQPFNIFDLKGNFYLIYHSEKSVEIYNSLFSVLPIYYSQKHSVISNSISQIFNYSLTSNSIEKKFILENLIFNYGLFDRSLYKEIHLLPSNSYIRINDKNHFEIVKHTFITDFFPNSMSSGKKTLDILAGSFIQNVSKYFPPEPFSITFTGGFDGRTLVACAQNERKEFRTCSFGIYGNDDVDLPHRQAALLNIPYSCYSLNSDSYLTSGFQFHVDQLISHSPGFNAFLYPHFSYLAHQESEKCSCLVTGYFGSELFRALHITGALSSELLKQLFVTKDDKLFVKSVRESRRLELLNLEFFKVELEELIEELVEYRRHLNNELSLNQQFYVFVFEEMFRKIFGTLITAQSEFIRIRTPFLDFEFIISLLSSSFAGINNDFFTHNPMKRFKGQRVYAEIIRRTNPVIYKQMTGKGYAPADLANPLRYPKILIPYLHKKIIKNNQPENLDNLGIISGIKKNKFQFDKSINSENDYFNIQLLRAKLESLTPFTPESERDSLLHSLSLYTAINANRL
jgi:asparagine synthase (glutamine-hydrolysing)